MGFCFSVLGFRTLSQVLNPEQQLEASWTNTLCGRGVQKLVPVKDMPRMCPGFDGQVCARRSHILFVRRHPGLLQVSMMCSKSNMPAEQKTQRDSLLRLAKIPQIIARHEGFADPDTPGVLEETRYWVTVEESRQDECHPKGPKDPILRYLDEGS